MGRQFCCSHRAMKVMVLENLVHQSLDSGSEVREWLLGEVLLPGGGGVSRAAPSLSQPQLPQLRTPELAISTRFDLHFAFT